MSIHNKSLPSCCRVQSSFTGCSAHEIELKQICRLLSEAPWQALVLLSKDIVEKLWSFVKSYGYENRSRGLVRYVILYSVNPSNFFRFGLFLRAPLVFSKFQKVGISVYPLQKFGSVYSFQIRIAPSKLESMSRVRSGAAYVINKKDVSEVRRDNVMKFLSRTSFKAYRFFFHFL